MNELDVINMLGSSLAFIGTIIFSVEFIKSKEQISDETKTYFGGNKYLKDSNIASQPLHILAFILIISGFGLNISSQISKIFSQGIQLQLAVIFSFIFCALSIVITEQVYFKNQNNHKKRRAQLKWDIYLSTLKNIPERYENKDYGIIGKHNEKQLFTLYRDGDIKNIKAREDELTDIRGRLIDTAKLKMAKDVSEYIGIIKEFLKKENIN